MDQSLYSTSTPASRAHAADLINHWDKTRRYTLVLLAIWFLSTFGIIFFARELNTIHVFGWPLSFYMAAQGMLLIYLAIVVLYMRRMKRIEQLIQQTQQTQLSSEPVHGE
ncbi:DUF4212 domain-containing protein [Herbaspirillum lusitanum]|jgi:putative solute:sodium symporter small subunit|uniref:DUF4212 domain-containing protein n=1 Tax=Herbaspirillum lusitanum TaxID=213312 RepID=A0ABW9A804_9BURK